MGHSIDISQLKNPSNLTTQEKEPNKNNTGKNIDGKELQDFGNGLKEFDPTANGFEPVKIERLPNDKDRALAAFDKQMEQRREEVEKYNELLDQYGGEISEEDLRKELNQEFITDTLQDGRGQKFEDNADGGSDIKATVASQNKEVPDDEINHEYISEEQKELDELERELEEDDNMGDYGNNVQEGTESFVDPNLAKYKEKMATEETKKEDPISMVDKIHEKVEPEKPTMGAYAGPVEPEPTTTQKISDIKPSVSTGTMNTSNIEAPKTSDMSEEDKDLEALENDNETPVDDFDEKLKAELSKKLKPVSKKFDLSSAVVTTTPTTVTNALRNVVPLDKRVFTWGLINSKRPITVKTFTATELNNLSSYMNREADSREVFKVIWDHLTPACKGRDFDTWLKTTSYFDVNHIWFAIYGACFQDTNYLPYTCNNCNNVTVTTHIPIEDMCKFHKKEVKNELYKIMSMPSDPANTNIFAEYRVQVSDNIVVGFREPSIYGAVIEPNIFDREFRTKYNDIIGLLAYISNIYAIRVDNNQVQLSPIAVKEFIGNETKTAKARVIQYAKIIRSLSSDQYNMILGHINSINNKEDITYCLPAVTCDHCKKEIPEDEEAAADLVFMRHRLAILGV